jgi:hypothetical protein
MKMLSKSRCSELVRRSRHFKPRDRRRQQAEQSDAPRMGEPEDGNAQECGQERRFGMICRMGC